MTDERFWDSLDQVIVDMWPSLKEFLDQAFEYKDEFHPVAQAFLFGGIGKFVLQYKNSRQDLNSSQDSLQMAIKAVYDDERIKSIQTLGVNNAIDKKVEDLF